MGVRRCSTPALPVASPTLGRVGECAGNLGVSWYDRVTVQRGIHGCSTLTSAGQTENFLDSKVCGSVRIHATVESQPAKLIAFGMKNGLLDGVREITVALKNAESSLSGCPHVVE